MLSIHVGASRHRARAWVLAVPLLSALFLAVGAGDAAAWQSLGDLGPGGQVMQAAKQPVAVARDGRSVFVWEDHGAVYARSVEPDGTFGWLTTVSGDGIEPIVALDRHGNATVVWHAVAKSRVETRTISPTGAMGEVQVLSTPDVYPTIDEVKVTPSGYALFSWLADTRTEDREVIQARSRSNGVLSPVENVAVYRHNNGQVLSGDMALGPNGDAVFAWWRFGDTIRSRRRAADGTLGRLRTVASRTVGDGRFGFPLAVALDPHGAATVAFVAHDCRSTSSCFSRVLSRTEDTPIANVSPVGEAAFGPQLAFDAHGDALFMWSTPQSVRARGRSPAGVLGPVQTIAGDSSSPSLAVSRDGSAAFAWMHFIKLGFLGGPSTVRPWARARSAAGVLGPPQALDGKLMDNYTRIAVAMNGSGRAAAMYEAGDAAERGALGP